MKYAKLFDEVKEEIVNKFNNVFSSNFFLEKLNKSKKEDNTVVTEIDNFISYMIKEKVSNKDYAHFNYYSEEDHGDLKFPAIIVDPIDGTKELVMAAPECALSLGLFEDSLLDFKGNQALIYNPFTGFEINSLQKFQKPLHHFDQSLFGLVSRSEWNKGLFNEMLNNNNEIVLFPKGSIANKLGLLAAGACDFVVSMKPKNIWDIAGGTLLCHNRSILFFEKGVEIKNLDKAKYYPPLCWCRKKDYERLRIFST